MRFGPLFLGLLLGASGVTGASAQAGLDEAYGLLAEGRTSEGRMALMEASAALAPSAAVVHLKAVRLLGGLTPPLQPQVARALADAHAGRPAAALETLVALSDGAGPEDAPPLLAYTAVLAEAVGSDQVEPLRLRIVTGYPEAAEWPDAVLEVAEARAQRDEELSEAMEWLRALIEREPQGAQAPRARALLERLETRP